MKTNKNPQSLETVSLTELNAVTGGAAWNNWSGASTWQNQGQQWNNNSSSNWSAQQNWSR